jgi:hypothetical protein
MSNYQPDNIQASWAVQDTKKGKRFIADLVKNNNLAE